jgi:hypothetical protein
MNAKLTVLTIDPSQVRNMFQRALLVARLPRATRLLSVVALPNVLELLGMSSGGGPPGFNCLVPVLDPKEPKQPEQNFFFIGYPPGAMMRLDSDECSLGTYLGCARSSGMVLNYFELVAMNDELRSSPIEELTLGFSKENLVLLPLVEYTTPPEIAEALLKGLGKPL